MAKTFAGAGRRLLAAFCILSGILTHSLVQAATHAEPPRVVRVGFFAFDGYHNIDEHGEKSGYGYEVLQRMKRHANWKYEYVGYEKSWAEMLEMLKRGEIDMLTSAGMSEERRRLYEYSDCDVGHTSVIMTARADDSRFKAGDRSTYEGMRVGLIKGSGKNSSLDTFALEKGFSYETVYFDNTEMLEKALMDHTVDVIMTSGLRRTDDEKKLEEFATNSFYVITKKGNRALMDEVNRALIRMSNNEPHWREKLILKYYEHDNSEKIRYSEADIALLKSLKADDKVFHVLARPDNYPYSYRTSGRMRGILPDLFDSMAKKAGIRYDYYPVKDIEEYWEAFDAAKADMVIDATTSFQKNEALGMENVGTYMTTPVSGLHYRSEENETPKLMTVRGLTVSGKVLGQDNVDVCPSYRTCIAHLENGDCTTVLLPSLKAEDYMLADYRNRYQATVLPNQTLAFSLLVKSDEYLNISSLMAKALSSINNEDVDRVTFSYRNGMERALTLPAFFYANPLLFFGIALLVAGSVGTALVVTLRRKKALRRSNSDLLVANEYLRKRDPLTNNYNIEGFLEGLMSMRTNGRDLTKYAILVIDIQDFKIIDEKLGRLGADKLLLKLNARFSRKLRPALSARAGGDDFAFCIERSRLNAALLKETLVFEQEADGRNLKIHCLCGIYAIDDNSISVGQMLHNAQIALHFVSEDPSQPYMRYESSMTDEYVDRADVLLSFEEAICKREMMVYYQPIIDVSTGRPASAEALIRWKRPGKGWISPAIIVPELEKHGHISKLDAFVEHEVVNFVTTRRAQGLPVVPVSVNLSPKDFHDRSFISSLTAEEHRDVLSTGLIRYEVTETAFAEVEATVREVVDDLLGKGGMFVLDDFGSGYSSFGMIERYPFGILKIDMSFTKQLRKNEKVRIIVETIISMSHRLGIKVVAEGVEHPEEVAILKGMGCDYIQGYYYSKPLSEEDFIKYLDEAFSEA